MAEANLNVVLMDATEIAPAVGDVTVATSPIDSEAITEAELIAAAKGFNRSAQFHLRRSAEEFWRMGEVLESLSQRPAARGRWRQILDEIGINRTSANQAQRLFKEVDLAGLAEYRNKTHALRGLGILKSATIEATGQAPTRAAGADRADGPANVLVAGAAPVGVTAADLVVPGKEDAPTALNSEAEIRAEHGLGEVEVRSDETSPVAVPATDPLTVLAQVAARLEYLVGEEFEITPEVAAQINRLAKASDSLRLRAKEATRAAA